MALISDHDKDFDNSFNQTQLEILLKADIDENLSLFSALGFLHESDIDFSNHNQPIFRDFDNRVVPIIAWANYQASPSLAIQLGRYVTPHGIINVEHFPPVLLETNQPQFLRPFSGNTIFPNFLNGIHLHGKLFLGENDNDILNYNMYSGVFVNGDPDDLISGGRLAYTFREAGIKVGINYSYGTRTAGQSNLGHLSVVGKKSLTSNIYNMVGSDVLFDKGKLSWKNEIFNSFEHGEPDRLGFYTQPIWRFNDQWAVFYRYDLLDSGSRITESDEHVLGINYLPTSFLRLRAFYILKELKDPDARNGILQLSGTISF